MTNQCRVKTDQRRAARAPDRPCRAGKDLHRRGAFGALSRMGTNRNGISEVRSERELGGGDTPKLAAVSRWDVREGHLKCRGRSHCPSCKGGGEVFWITPKRKRDFHLLPVLQGDSSTRS